MSRKSAIALIRKMPTNPAYEALTLEQLEALTDQIVFGEDETNASEALIVLMDEIERLSLTEPSSIEAVTVVIKRHAYYRLKDTEKRSTGFDNRVTRQTCEKQIREDLNVALIRVACTSALDEA